MAFSPVMRFHERGGSAGWCAADVFPDPEGGQPKANCFNWAAYNLPYFDT